MERRTIKPITKNFILTGTRVAELEGIKTELEGLAGQSLSYQRVVAAMMQAYGRERARGGDLKGLLSDWSDGRINNGWYLKHLIAQDKAAKAALEQDNDNSSA